MDGTDVLQTIAEVSIALTGFTGIAATLRGSSGVSLKGFDVIRFRVLLFASLAALATSLLPFLLLNLGLSPENTWSASSATVIAFLIPVAIHDARAFRTFSDDMPLLDRRLAPLFALLGAALVCTQFVNVSFRHSFGLYLIAPMWFLGFAAFQFCRLLLVSEQQKGQ